MVRKIWVFALILALTLTFSGPFTVRAADAEREEAAQRLSEMGLLRGTGGEGAASFELDRSLTRNEAVTMLVRLLGKEGEAKAKIRSAPFTDVPAWAEPYVGYAYAAGLTNGVGENRFGGSGAVSAAQYLTFLLRAMGYRSGEDFRWDRAWELTDRLGITEGRYGPDSAFTRGDAALVSLRALSAYRKGGADTLLTAYHGQETPKWPAAEPLEVHFLDVGEADAILVRCADAAMLVDGGNAEDSRLIYSYLQSHGVKKLTYVFCTHPHEDHAGGLAGALHYAAVGTAFCSMTDFDTTAFRNFVKALEGQGKHLVVPKAGDVLPLGGAKVEVLGPARESENVNDMSLVLRLTYGETSVLLTGDAEREEEQDLLKAALGSTVLKVGHHGSDTSTTYPFLRAAAPEYAVISVGENLYGHPADSVLSRLRDAEVQVLRTDELGHIVMTSDGVKVRFTSEKGQSVQAAVSGGNYVLNVKSLLFHRPDCESVGKMSEKNKRIFDGTREEAINLGYKPCNRCTP